MSWIHNVPPSSLGFPDKITSWREDQAQAIQDILDSDARFVALQAPPGLGKSAIGIAAALISQDAAVYLTITKALMDQVEQDFSGTRKLAAIKGANAYQCADLELEDGSPSGYSCEEYQKWCKFCHCPEHLNKKCSPVWCEKWANRCPRRQAYQNAVRAPLTLTNYAYWHRLNRSPHPSALADGIKLLILDEAHDAPETIADLVSVSFTPRDLWYLGARGPKNTDSARAWSEWAEETIEQAASTPGFWEPLKKRHSSHVKFTLAKERLGNKLKEAASISGFDNWAVDPVSQTGAKLTPLWPGAHAKSMFLDIPKIVLMSATITPLTVRLLGIKPEDHDFLLYPYSFDRVSKTVHVQTTQVGTKAFAPGGKGNKRLWLDTIVRFLEARTDRKGLVTVPSYALAEEIASYLREEHPHLYKLVRTHNSDTTGLVIESYKADPNPCWLISPAVATGYDFPGSQCEFVLIPKLFFAPSQSQVMKARIKKNKLYLGNLMAQQLIQASGRGRRSKTDPCEVVILDDNYIWSSRAYRSCFAAWFKCPTIRRLPKPPPSIRRLAELEEELKDGTTN
jgi:Rad3-related DNA helicase